MYHYQQAVSLQNQNHQRTEIKSEQTQVEPVNVHHATLPWASLSFVMGGAVVFIILTKILQERQNNQNNKFSEIKPPTHIPCVNCHFFANNSYLKCAVNPYIVFTEKALNCFDYRPKNGKII